jgi:hypothetical protein
MTLLSLFGSQNGRVSYNRTSLAAILQWLFAILLLGLVSCFSAGAKPTAETTDGADAKTLTESTDGADAKTTTEITEGADAKTTTESTDGTDAKTTTDMTVTLLGAASWHFPVVALYQSSSSREWKQKRWTLDDTEADKELTFNLSGGEDIKLLVFSFTKVAQTKISWNREGEKISQITKTCSHPKNEHWLRFYVKSESNIDYSITCTMNTPKKLFPILFRIKEAEGKGSPIENALVKVTTQKQEDYAYTNKRGVAIIPLHKPTQQTRIRVEKEGFNRFAGTLQKISGLHTDFPERRPPIELFLSVDKFLLSLQLVDSSDKTPINLSTLDNVSVVRDKGNKPIPRNQIELNNSGGYITLPYFSLLTKQERNEQIKIIVTEPDYNTEEVTISLKDSAWKSTGTRQWFRELQIPLRQKGTGLLVIINPAKNWSRYNLTRHIVRTQLGKLLKSSSTYSQVGIGVLGGEMEMLIGKTTEPVETRRSILRQLRRGIAIHGRAQPEKIVELLKKHEDKLYRASQWHIIIVIPHDPFAYSPEDTTLNRMTELLIKHNVELSIIEDGEPNGSDFYKKLAQWQQGQKQQYFKHLPVDSEEGLQQQITNLIVAE